MARRKKKQDADPSRDRVLREYNPPTRIVSYGLRDLRLDQFARFTVLSPADIRRRRAANKVARASRKANR